jgi:hypothetical protein
MHEIAHCTRQRAHRVARSAALTAFLTAGLVVYGGCATTPTPNTEPSTSGRVMVAVSNDGFNDAEVYALYNGTRYHLGFVPSNRTVELRVPASALGPANDLQLVVHRVGDSGTDYVAETVHVDPDQIAEFNIQPRVEMSTLSVRER